MERIATHDERLAQAGIVRLRGTDGGPYYYKRLEDLTREDRLARIGAERDQIAWLRGRIEDEKMVGRWRNNAQDRLRADREQVDGDDGRHDDGGEVEEGH